MSDLEERISELPPDLRREVEDFVDFLLTRRQRVASGPLKLDWAGSLAEMKDRYTSVELQHQIARWRSGDE